jgi:hypothetical protein
MKEMWRLLGVEVEELENRRFAPWITAPASSKTLSTG